MTDKDRIAKLEGALRQVRTRLLEKAAIDRCGVHVLPEEFEGIADMIDNVLAYSARISIEQEQAQHDKEMMK